MLSPLWAIVLTGRHRILQLLWWAVLETTQNKHAVCLIKPNPHVLLTGCSLLSLQLALSCYIQGLCLKLTNCCSSTLEEEGSRHLKWDGASSLPLSPGVRSRLVHNTQTPGIFPCNGNLLSHKYEITDRHLGKSPAAKGTCKALTHRILVAQCLN